jgi:GNAT superfamily N-acetyltransferase
MKITDLREVPECIQLLAEWHHLEWSYFNPGGSVQKRIEKMQAYLGWQTVPRMFVCKDDGLLLGSAGIVLNDMDTKMELSPWLASVYVDKNHRKRGIGSALVKQVLDYARAAGFSDLYLFTQNQANFYKGFGWYPISNELYCGQKVTVMQIKLRG